MELAGHGRAQHFMIGDGVPDVLSALRAGVPLHRHWLWIYFRKSLEKYESREF